MNSKKPGLLALLPKPKGVSQTKAPELPSNSALPKLGPSQTLEKTQQIEETTKTVEFKKINDKSVGTSLLGIVDYSSDSNDDDENEGIEKEKIENDEQIDFFGLKNSSEPASKKICLEGEDYDVLNEPQIFFEEVAPGPSRLFNYIWRLRKRIKCKFRFLNDNLSNDTSISCLSDEKTPSVLRSITDQEASRLIFERELVPNGVYNSAIADEAISGMIDVSVDAALGPNIRENLLRNLNTKQMAQMACGPLPKLPQGGDKTAKTMPERLAKRKHQITHLAQVAISREEQLQEKWAEGRQQKKMSRQKYGF
ncbi:unnamed protein product [Meloidogyne enterolobii]|uniref:Uncharacterized protein n=1 Tax=Meloidogyne enterolobii TaxID=390850 RepID=A0ACB0ZBN5_MELEN